MINDTDVTQGNELFQDEELEWLLTQNSNVYLAAANACETLASRYRSSATSKSVGGLSISFSAKADEWANQAKLLREQATTLDSSIPVPISTAQSISEKEERWSDTDLNHGDAYLGMHDNEGTGAYAG